MTDYRQHGQRKRHHPLERPVSSPPKFTRGSREWTGIQLRKDSFAAASSVCPPYILPYHDSVSHYPHHVPQSPLSGEHPRRLFHKPEAFYGYSFPEGYPCPSPGWDGYYNMQPALKAMYPGLHPVRYDNFVEDTAFSQMFPRQTEYGHRRLTSQSRSGGQHRDKDHYRGQQIYHQKLSVCGGKNHGRGGSQSVNKGKPTLQKQITDNSKPVCVTNMSEKLRLFVEKLKKFPVKENSIQTIENCVSASHLPIKTFFIVDETHSKPDFSGALYINDVFIARCRSNGKRVLKHKVYDTALQILKTRSVQDLMAQADLGLTLEQLPIEAAAVKDEMRSKIDDNLRGKLLKLQNCIKKSKFPQNLPFMIFDMAFLESKCRLNHRFDVESIRSERGTHLYTRTRVMIEGKAVAYSAALCKKESKTSACQKAVNLFISKDIDTILKEHFENGEVVEEELSQEIKDILKKHKERRIASKSVSAVVKHEQEECLDRLIQDLKLPAKDGVSTVMTIDKNCVQVKMKLLAVYKTVRSQGQQALITCDLYILDHLIAQGKATTRKGAQSDAYSKGGEILKKSTGADVLTFPKFNEEELNKPDVMEVVYKGYTKVSESNRCRLNRLKQLPEEQRKISDLVIIEHSDWAEDRKKHSLCILNQSATQCGCLLEWTTEPENDCFRCTMKLQGKEIASVLAERRKTAVSMASSVALFNLYETQAVVQGFHLDYPKVWISRDELVKYSQSQPEDCQTALVVQLNGGQEVDKKISRAMQEMLDQFFSVPTLEDFVGAPDWKPEEKKLLRILAIARGLRVVTEVYCEEWIPIVSRKYDLSEMVNILEKQANKSQGRYRLLLSEEKPSYNDIAGEVAANESIVKKYQVSIGVSDDQEPIEAADVDEDADMNTYSFSNDVSLISDDAFITANSSFFDVAAGRNKIKAVNTTPSQKISETHFPTRTSTPVRAAAEIATKHVDESELLQTVLSTSTSDEPRETKHPICTSSAVAELSQINFNSSVSTSAAVLRISSDEEFPSLPPSSVSTRLPLTLSSDVQTRQMKRHLDQSQSSLSSISLTDSQEIRSPRSGTHANVMQPRQFQPKSKPLHKKLNRSIDLEAGIKDVLESQRVQQDQYWSHRQNMQQQQWVEQEQAQNYLGGSAC